MAHGKHRGIHGKIHQYVASAQKTASSILQMLLTIRKIAQLISQKQGKIGVFFGGVLGKRIKNSLRGRDIIAIVIRLIMRSQAKLARSRAIGLIQHIEHGLTRPWPIVYAVKQMRMNIGKKHSFPLSSVPKCLMLTVTYMIM
jgi:hypothetical protein